MFKKIIILLTHDSNIQAGGSASTQANSYNNSFSGPLPPSLRLTGVSLSHTHTHAELGAASHLLVKLHLQLSRSLPFFTPTFPRLSWDWDHQEPHLSEQLGSNESFDDLTRDEPPWLTARPELQPHNPHLFAVIVCSEHNDYAICSKS